MTEEHFKNTMLSKAADAIKSGADNFQENYHNAALSVALMFERSALGKKLNDSSVEICNATNDWIGTTPVCSAYRKVVQERE